MPDFFLILLSTLALFCAGLAFLARHPRPLLPMLLCLAGMVGTPALIISHRLLTYSHDPAIQRPVPGPPQPTSATGNPAAPRNAGRTS